MDSHLPESLLFSEYLLGWEHDVARAAIICATEDRPAFMQWLRWNVERQTYADIELVLVDSSGIPASIFFEDCEFPVTCLTVPPGTTVGEKSNLAMAATEAKYIFWFGDDDWQHPERIERSVKTLEEGFDVAGFHRAYYLQLWEERARICDHGRMPHHSLSGFRADAVRQTQFDYVPCGSDTRWMSAISRYGLRQKVDLSLPAASLWLIHGRNMSTFLSDVYPTSFAEVEEALGEAIWGDTTEQVTALRARLMEVGHGPKAEA